MLNISRDLESIPLVVLAQVNEEYRSLYEWFSAGLSLTCTKEEYLETAFKSKSPRDKFFYRFNEVRTDGDWVIITGAKDELHINRHGVGSWYKEQGKNKRTFKKQGGGNHYELNFANTRVNVEACMYFAGCLLFNKFPFSFEGFVINVVDTTGTHQQVNLDFQNLELTIQEANLAVAKKPGVLANKAYDFKKFKQMCLN